MGRVLDLVCRAEEAGLRLEAHGDRIRVVGPRSAAALVEELKAHKAEVLVLLANAPTSCARCGDTEDRLVGTYWSNYSEGLCPPCVALVVAEFDESESWPPAP